jgi:hypothetical protein
MEAFVAAILPGSVDQIIITNPGMGYSVGDELIPNNNMTGGTGLRAVVSSVDSAELLNEDGSIWLTEDNQEIFLEGVIVGAVLGVEILDPGQSYFSLPLIGPPNTGTGATFLAGSSTIGQISKVGILDSGYGFTSPPTIVAPVNAIITDISGSFIVGETIESTQEQLLLEDGAALLQENGTALLLEMQDAPTGVFDVFDSNTGIITLRNIGGTGSFLPDQGIIGATSGATATIRDVVTPAFTGVVGVETESIGTYLGTSGQISEASKRIQDSFFYQDFSYLIKVGQSLNTYKDTVKRLLHPVGMALFGQVETETLARVEITVSDLLNSVQKFIIQNKMLIQMSLQEFVVLRLPIEDLVDPSVSRFGPGFSLAELDEWKFFYPPYAAGEKGTPGNLQLYRDAWSQTYPAPNASYWSGGLGNTQIKDFSNLTCYDFVFNPHKKIRFGFDAYVYITQSP